MNHAVAIPEERLPQPERALAPLVDLRLDLSDLGFDGVEFGRGAPGEARLVRASVVRPRKVSQRGEFLVRA